MIVMADITTKKITSVDDTLNISALFVNDNGTLKQMAVSSRPLVCHMR